MCTVTSAADPIVSNLGWECWGIEIYVVSASTSRVACNRWNVVAWEKLRHCLPRYLLGEPKASFSEQNISQGTT